MCTVTWLRQPGSFEVFFNRDERLTRKAALAPQLGQHNGVKTLAPQDGDHGGTWIGVNAFGLTVGLLNHYQGLPPPAEDNVTSRGLLVQSLLDCRHCVEVERRIAGMPLGTYRPFMLMSFDPKGTLELNTWDGRTRTSRQVLDDDRPVSTSSFEPENVLPQRRQRFMDLKKKFGDVNAEMLEAYHKSRDPRGDAYSVCMNRDDAQTVSFSHVRVRPDSVEFHYEPRSPDGGFGTPTVVVMPRS